ncbi:hypothetical protein BJY00DRAFT_297195 [Aspergillus carlsbadensis]|nr:hypothetical protein BJY00DRAFT_297195 [Aspergillus carlsbadensis]
MSSAAPANPPTSRSAALLFPSQRPTQTATARSSELTGSKSPVESSSPRYATSSARSGPMAILSLSSR